MNRRDFMEQLDQLLQEIPSAEREEALQYYNDYFDDAGQENEQAVMKALGNPARVAENIKRDLTENGAPTRAKASDEAIVEYGKAYEEENRQEKEVPAVNEPEAEPGGAGGESGSSGSGGGTGYYDKTGTGGVGSGSSGYKGGSGTGGYGGGSGSSGNGSGSSYGGGTGSYSGGSSGYRGGSGSSSYSGGSSGYNGASGSGGRSGRSVWAVLLIVFGAIFLSPAALGLLSVLFGLVVCWLALIFCAGVMTLSLFVVWIVLVVVGIMCIFMDPLAGVGVIGGGLIVGGLALLSLMLTVAMGGIITPGIFKGIGRLFRLGRKAGRQR